MPVREKDVGAEGGDPGQGREAVSCEHPQGPASSCSCQGGTDTSLPGDKGVARE